VTEGLSLASAGKTAVSEFFATNGELPTDNADAGLASAGSISGNSVHSVLIENGAITVTFSGAPIEGNELVLTPTEDDEGGNITWDCTQGDLAPKYRPSSCRE
jgi:type IV pilus assembly protein PilA